MSTVERNSERVRPSWNYVVGNKASTEYSTLEMIESARNVLEQIRNSQMLQCDVAHAIKQASNELIEIAKQIRGLRRDLKKVRP